MTQEVDIPKLIEDLDSVLERVESLLMEVPLYSSLSATIQNATRALRGTRTSLVLAEKNLPKLMRVHKAASDTIRAQAAENAIAAGLTPAQLAQRNAAQLKERPE